MTHRDHTPLVAFTSLAIAGAGLIAADAVLMATALAPLCRPAVALGLALQATGVAVSLLHLGQASRAPRALRGVGPSALSNEILMAGLAMASGAALLVVARRGEEPAAWRALAGMCNVAFLFAIGLVYRIRGQRTWTGLAVLTPLSAGCAFGGVFLQVLSVPGGPPHGVVFLLGADAALFLLRWRETASLNGPADGEPAGGAWTRRHQWFAARILLLDAVPFGLLHLWPTPIATVAAAAGLVIDRAGFYALARPHTTEGEVARIDKAIETASARRQP